MDNERTQWAARMLAQRVNGMAVLYPAALRMKHPFPQMEEKYAKLAYCSRYAFSAARSQRTPEEAAAPISTPCRELMISVERASKLSPYPVIPEVRLACSVTESL